MGILRTMTIPRFQSQTLVLKVLNLKTLNQKLSTRFKLICIQWKAATNYNMIFWYKKTLVLLPVRFTFNHPYIWGCLNGTPKQICNSNIAPDTNLPLITLFEIFSELSPVAFHSPQTPKTDIHQAFPRYLRPLYRYIRPLYRYRPLYIGLYIGI